MASKASKIKKPKEKEKKKKEKSKLKAKEMLQKEVRPLPPPTDAIQSISGKGGEDRRVCCLGSEAKGQRDSGSQWGSKELSGPQRLLTARLYLIQTPVKYSSALLLFFIF